MNTLRKAALVLFLATIAAATITAQNYDKDTVVKVMRQNVTLLGEIKAALGKGDFFAAGQAFWKFAENMESIRKFTPAKGSKAEWDTVIGEFVFIAMKGVGAAGEKDSVKAGLLLGELQALNKKGHSVFK